MNKLEELLEKSNELRKQISALQKIERTKSAKDYENTFYQKLDGFDAGTYYAIFEFDPDGEGFGTFEYIEVNPDQEQLVLRSGLLNVIHDGIPSCLEYGQFKTITKKEFVKTYNKVLKTFSERKL